MKKDFIDMTGEEFSNKYPRESVLYKNQLKNWATGLSVKNGVWDGNLACLNYWIFGVPGVGKSRWARSQCNDEMIIPKGICKWQNGYNPLFQYIPCLT